MYLAVGHQTSQEVWMAINAALGSSTRASALSLLDQLQSLRQSDSTTTEYLGRAQVLVEELAMVGRPVLLDEQNLYVLQVLRFEFRSMVSSAATK